MTLFAFMAFTQNFVYQSNIGPINILKCHIFHGESIPSPTFKKFSGLIPKKTTDDKFINRNNSKETKKKINKLVKKKKLTHFQPLDKAAKCSGKKIIGSVI